MAISQNLEFTFFEASPSSSSSVATAFLPRPRDHIIFVNLIRRKSNSHDEWWISEMPRHV